MQISRDQINNRKKKRSGQGLIEYIALTALVAIVCVGTIKVLGKKVETHIKAATRKFDSTLRGATSGRSSSDNDSNDDEPSRRRNSFPRIPGLF